MLEAECDPRHITKFEVYVIVIGYSLSLFLPHGDGCYLKYGS